jgi:hypothetical protein
VIFIPYSDLTLDETIDACDRLVDAIETHLPGAIFLEGDDVPYGLVDKSVPLQGLAHKFLLLHDGHDFR